MYHAIQLGSDKQGRNRTNSREQRRTTASDNYVWADCYDRELDDLFTVHE
jgi:TolB-like protein